MELTNQEKSIITNLLLNEINYLELNGQKEEIKDYEKMIEKINK